MKVTYTGRNIELSPAQSRKLEEQFEKVGKLLDNGRSNAEAHVILSHERYSNNVEVTVPYHNHELVGQSSDPDLFTALHAAVEKLEKQALRVREKWRDGKRVSLKDGALPEIGEEIGKESGKNAGKETGGRGETSPA